MGSARDDAGWLAPANALQGEGQASKKMKHLAADHPVKVTTAASAVSALAIYYYELLLLLVMLFVFCRNLHLFLLPWKTEVSQCSSLSACLSGRKGESVNCGIFT